MDAQSVAIDAVEEILGRMIGVLDADGRVGRMEMTTGDTATKVYATAIVPLKAARKMESGVVHVRLEVGIDDPWLHVQMKWARDVLPYWWTFERNLTTGRDTGMDSQVTVALEAVRRSMARSVVRKTLDRAYRTRKKTKAEWRIGSALRAVLGAA
jgi:hypothetical protein